MLTFLKVGQLAPILHWKYPRNVPPSIGLTAVVKTSKLTITAVSDFAVKMQSLSLEHHAVADAAAAAAPVSPRPVPSPSAGVGARAASLELELRGIERKSSFREEAAEPMVEIKVEIWLGETSLNKNFDQLNRNLFGSWYGICMYVMCKKFGLAMGWRSG